MLLAATLDGDRLLAVAAVLSAVAGLLTAWASLIRARAEVEQQCQTRVQQLRAESEAMAIELHQLRLAKTVRSDA